MSECKMYFGYIKAIAFIVAGVLLSLWSAYSWVQTGFVMGVNLTPEARDGGFLVSMIIIGIVMAAYGYFSLDLLSRDKPD